MRRFLRSPFKQFQLEQDESAASIVQEEHDLARKGKMQNLPINKIFRQDNVRTPATLQIPEMIASIKRHGYKHNHPLVVSAKRDGRYLVLCGNRRFEAIETILAQEPETFNYLFPDGTVPCVVYEGLTEEQEVIIRIDHGSDEDRVPLDEWGEFLAIKQLVKAGYDTQAGIAAKMGWFKLNRRTNVNEPNRSKVQQRVNLAQLPKFVQDEFEKYIAEGPQASPVRWTDVAGLYKAFNEEFRQYPEGNGPQFQEAWAKVTTPAPAGEAAPRSMSVAELEKRAKVVNSPLLRKVLMTVSGNQEYSLTDLDAEISKAEYSVMTLNAIEQALGEEQYQKLLRRALPTAERATG